MKPTTKKEKPTHHSRVMLNHPCLCGSMKEQSECCLLYISGHSNPPNAEALMRSRFVAYAISNLDYIKKTMRGQALDEFISHSSENHKHIEWLSLKISAVENESTGASVTFKAYFFDHKTKKRGMIHEKSHFICNDNIWYYVKAEWIKSSQH
jgi:SEC-C motif-containing protein